MIDFQHTVANNVELKKTRKGWIGNKLRQVHLRDDIGCGFQICQYHKSQPAPFAHEPLQSTYIYLIDTYTLIHQTDIIYNSTDIASMIILQSSIEKLRNYNPYGPNNKNKKFVSALNKYNAFKAFVETLENSTDRALYILPDNYHRPIKQRLDQDQDSQKQLRDSDDFKHLSRCLHWYEVHAKEIGLTNIKFQLLTANPAFISKQADNILSLIQFLHTNNSNLLDFMGFESTAPIFGTNVHHEHVQIEDAIKKVQQGKLFEGKFMNQRSYFRIGSKMFKVELINNRALYGDVVMIELLGIHEWKIKFKKVEDQVMEQEGPEVEQTANSQIYGLLDYLQRNPNLTPVGRVISIYKRQQRNYCGTVNFEKLVYDSSNEMKEESSMAIPYKIYEFVPADSKFNTFYIRTYSQKTLLNNRIIVCFDQWPANSEFPLCHYVRTIGPLNDDRTEADTILLEHNVEIKQFSKAAYACLPPQGEQFIIPAEEDYRLDLRNIDVCSIDPPGCKDIDDALHCIQLQNGNLEIGVHIADVSYYVRPDSALDLEARNRSTTVYLVNRRTDMLPKLLTENLCSLRANVDRLAFSTIWQVDREANIINTKYTKTIIRSRRAFTYGQAQELMNSASDCSLAKSIRNLNKIAKKLKEKRTQNGALTLASTQVKITLDEQTHSATDVQLYQLMDTNSLIEQFMLLANIAVAEKIYERFPSISILRRHIQPKVSDLTTLKQIMGSYGYKFSFESSKQLADSLNSISRKGDQFFNKLVRIMTTRCMNEATYFCSADFDISQFYHYGLAAPFYTHFTSPIRRYADILVHRLLAASIDLQPLPTFMINKMKMTKICDNMNMRNRMARYASRASSDYHTYQFFKGKNTIEKGVVTAIDEDSVTIMLIKYGLESRIKLTAKDMVESKGLNVEGGIACRVNIEGRVLSLFEYVDVEVRVELVGFHKLINLRIV